MTVGIVLDPASMRVRGFLLEVLEMCEICPDRVMRRGFGYVASALYLGVACGRLISAVNERFCCAKPNCKQCG